MTGDVDNVRVRWSPYRDTCHMVEWGDTPPLWDDAARGRFYGYSDTAITAFLQEGMPQASPSPLGSSSDGVRARP
ncbi:DUF6302 family protein [Streptantibioticus ferralitis]|uniref:DUF6302 family protein n=1 Tax=Streptantibioticus ferralitis TaxID=236510 RepID=A0ABT5Z3L3_9ACTN|nr:DUF6302 family protein [Streptantibioticus ferralitis]MDF2258389.1 DUF6302 family protein [Streptantibioticus ferralitis]